MLRECLWVYTHCPVERATLAAHQRTVYRTQFCSYQRIRRIISVFSFRIHRVQFVQSRKI